MFQHPCPQKSKDGLRKAWSLASFFGVGFVEGNQRTWLFFFLFHGML